MKHKQKDTCIAFSGDDWFDGNQDAVSLRNYNESDPVVQIVDHCSVNGVKDARGGGRYSKWVVVKESGFNGCRKAEHPSVLAFSDQPMRSS